MSAVVDGHIKLTVDVGSIAVEEVGVLMQGHEWIDQAGSVAPFAQDEAVIVDRSGKFVLQVIYELCRQKRVVIDRGGLTENVHFGVVDEFLQKMLRTVRVRCAVKMTVRTAQAGLEHLKDGFVPGGHFVAVAVFDGHALNAGYMFLAVCTENVYPAAKQACSVVTADRAHKPLAPDLPHRVQNVPAKGALCVAQHNGSTFAPQSKQTLRDDHRIIQPAFAGTGGSDLQIPTVIAPGKIFQLLSR